MNPNNRETAMPPLGITMGCPAGIGPEIIVKALSRTDLSGTILPCVVLGDRSIMKRACRSAGVEHMEIRPWTPGERPVPGKINILPITSLSPDQVPFGMVSEITGRASYSYILDGIRLCRKRQLSGLVTAPINKSGLHMAGIDFPGHTEILAHETATPRYAMMLAGKRLRVTLVTIHCALREVPQNLTHDNILELITITDTALRELFLIHHPSIAVAALNPHAGEEGMFGDEEIRIIAPAVTEAASMGINVTGPLPPDTVFHAAWNGRFDAVVCMYHDQGLIPFKLVHFSDGVNITLGLPIIRTSVDHGTAYDLAGTGKASEDSLVAAMETASMFARNRLTKRS